ncbi:50S ribosomal protein L25 [Patulibacter sp.]|uniref:50S ribosomal protein L25 n=1 Tax=Patulibacter sp. TaxID=1912859 RepID=UPI0027280AA4|nr:50S ribosomal protein L25 [Patulibacter sp.]MDO9409244.1 50S ribosomal protein L25 [Patulibacter sp.]
MATNSSSLAVASREPAHSRESRRARRAGSVPGVIYGGSGDPVSIAVNERDLRHTLAAKGAVIDVAIDGGKSEPVVLKDAQRHPVRGQIVHVDLLRVDLKQKIEAVVPVEVVGADEAEAVKLGGIVTQIVREITVEALPNEIPENVTIDVTELAIGDNLTVGDIVVPSTATLVDDAEPIAVTMAAPRLASEVEAEEEAAAEAGALAAEGSEANESTVLTDDESGSDSDSSGDE